MTAEAAKGEKASIGLGDSGWVGGKLVAGGMMVRLMAGTGL